MTAGATASLTAGRLRPVILRLALPAVGMMACHFTFNLIDTMWVGRLIGPSALAAVSTGGFMVWIVLSLGEMMDVGLIAVAARRHGQGLADHAASRGLPLPREVCDYLLTRARRDMPSLLAAVDALDRYSLETRRPVTVPLARELLLSADAEARS